MPLVRSTAAGGGTHGCPADPPIDVVAGLIQLSGMVQEIYARVSERHDLTPAQARLLCVLLPGPRGMADLAQCFGVEKAALTGLMDRAERRGLAQRTAVPGDRRALHATLTDAGRRAAIAFHADVGTEVGRLAEALDPADHAHFRGMLAEIVTTCRSAPAPGRRSGADPRR